MKQMIDRLIAQREAENRQYGYLLADLIRQDRIEVRRAMIRALTFAVDDRGFTDGGLDV